MSDHVAKVIEVVGTSSESIDHAIHTAVARTAETVRKLRWFEMTELRGHIADGKVERFQVMLKLGFALDE